MGGGENALFTYALLVDVRYGGNGIFQMRKYFGTG
jgi:hypothetical protein